MSPKKRTRVAPKSDKKRDAPGQSSEANVARNVTRKRKREESGGQPEGQNNTRGTTSGTTTYSHWLMKSEPETRLENGVDVKFGIEDLKGLPGQTGCWDGVRNYQARNFMKEMKVDHQAFFYHSNCKEPGIAGLIKIVKEAYVDHTQFDKKDVHYDPSSKPENPKWIMVDVKFERMTKRFIPLAELKKYHLKHKSTGGPLSGLTLFTRPRLSVQPLTPDEFDFVLTLEDTDPV